MAGIYLHIPFCSKACHYCDFHFSVALAKKGELVDSLQTELANEKDYLGGEPIKTIYFGGGTPSLLEVEELEGLLQAIERHYAVSSSPEICLEANPEQLTPVYLRGLKSLGINRLSIGVQSFDQQILEWMNRSHSAEQSLDAVRNAAEAGFSSITIDLIYGIPSLTDEQWELALRTALDLPIDHLSAYSLTLEERTPYAHFVKKGTYLPPDEGRAEAQFRMLRTYFNANGWEHYEISNFAKNGAYSKHNTAYWQGVPYLGVGPSAHSYDGRSRSWNRSSNAAYIQAMQTGNMVREREVLSVSDRFNEQVLTGLRTKWGVKAELIQREETHWRQIATTVHEFEKLGWLKLVDGSYVLTEEGMLRADGISAELFMDHSSQRSS